MKNTIVFIVTYLIVMLLTYVWRLSLFSARIDGDFNSVNFINITWILLINYVVLTLIVYARGKAINKKYITAFPIVAGCFDIILVFVPFVPTIMNIITIVTSVSENKEKTIYIDNIKNTIVTESKVNNGDKSSLDTTKNQYKLFFLKIYNLLRWFLGCILIVSGIVPVLSGTFFMFNPFIMILGFLILPFNYRILNTNMKIILGTISFICLLLWPLLQISFNNHYNKSTHIAPSNTISEEEIAQKKTSLAALLKRIHKENDDFGERIIYESKNSVENWKDDCYLTLSYYKQDQSCILVWRVDYYADDWLFIKNFTVKADNQKFYITPSYKDIKRDNTASSIWEHIALDYKSNKEVINAIANSSNTTIRFYGKDYYNDRKLSKAKIKAMKDMLSLYQLCTEGYLKK